MAGSPPPAAAPRPSDPPPASKPSAPAASKPSPSGNTSSSGNKPASGLSPASAKTSSGPGTNQSPAVKSTSAPASKTPQTNSPDSKGQGTETLNTQTTRTATSGTPGSKGVTETKQTSGQDALAAQNKARIDQQQQQQRAKEATQRQTAENLRTATTSTSTTTTTTAEKTSGKSTSSSVSTSDTKSADEGDTSVDPNTGTTRGSKSVSGVDDGTDDGSSGDGGQDQNGQPKVDPKNGVQIAGTGDESVRAALDVLNAQRQSSTRGFDLAKLTTPDLTPKFGDFGIKDLNPEPAKQPATDPQATDKPATDKPATDPQATDKPVTDKPATDPQATDKPATDKPATDPQATDKPVTDKPATDPQATDKPATDKPATDPQTTEKPASEKTPQKVAEQLGIKLTGNEKPEEVTKLVEAELTRLARPDDKAPSGNSTRNKVFDKAFGENPDIKKAQEDIAAGKFKLIPEAGENHHFDTAAVLGISDPLDLKTGGHAEDLARSNQAAVARLNGVTVTELDGKTTQQIAAINQQKSVDYLKQQGFNLPENPTYAEVLKGYVDVYNKNYNANLPANASWSQIMEVWKQQNAGNPTVQQRAQSAGLTMNLTSADYEKYFARVSGLDTYRAQQRQTPQGIPPASPDSGLPGDGTPKSQPPPPVPQSQQTLDRESQRSVFQVPETRGRIDSALKTESRESAVRGVIEAVATEQGLTLTTEEKSALAREFIQQDDTARVAAQEKAKTNVSSILANKPDLKVKFEDAARSSSPESAIDAVLKEAGLTPEMDAGAIRDEIIRQFVPVKDPDRSIFRSLPRVETAGVNPFNSFGVFS